MIRAADAQGLTEAVRLLKAGSVVGVPCTSPVAVPGFMAMKAPGMTSLRAISSPRSWTR